MGKDVRLQFACWEASPNFCEIFCTRFMRLEECSHRPVMTCTFAQQPLLSLKELKLEKMPLCG